MCAIHNLRPTPLVSLACLLAVLFMNGLVESTVASFTRTSAHCNDITCHLCTHNIPILDEFKRICL